ncbi:MAG: molybdopterin-dependent oxidoreductase [Desulfurococcaceae archaeon]
MVKLEITRCYETISGGLIKKGVKSVVDCAIEGFATNRISDLRELVSTVFSLVFKDIKGLIAFESNEPIGYTHTLHGFRIYISDTRYLGVRVVARGQNVIRVLYTIPEGIDKSLSRRAEKYSPGRDMVEGHAASSSVESGAPPGQYFIDIPVIYTILGVPEVDASSWSLKVEGEVENPIELTLTDLYKLGIEEITTDFHCVTGWSVRSVNFAGTPLFKIVELVRPKKDVEWIYAESLDKYSTIVPYAELNKSKSLVALEMNGQPLDILHGYPARLIFPHLYGWKSAKWVSRLVFTGKYSDGYWESLGYHPRGRVWKEERFKLS